MKIIYRIFFLVSFAAVLPCVRYALPAETGPTSETKLHEQIRVIRDEESRELLVTEKSSKKEADFNLLYGAWVIGDYLHLSEIDNDKEIEDWVKDIFSLDVRPWINAEYCRTLTLYGRLKNAYTWRPRVASDYTGIGDDFEGPKVDSLFALVDLEARYSFPFSVKTGRQYLFLGRGITYANTHDAIVGQYIFRQQLVIRGFVAKTKENEDNIDYSVPGYDKEGDRVFYGSDITFYIPNHIFYLYGLIQEDRSHPHPEDVTQNFRYNSEYLGGGAAGNFVFDNFVSSYWVEGIKEFGHSYTDATQTSLEKRDVSAWAINTGLKYEILTYGHPVAEAEFAYGSGDKDRSSVTNAIGGNIDGDDTNFLYFGLFNAGYALAPRLSNIFIYKFGLAAKPVEFIPYVGQRLVTGTRFYIYSKEQRGGGIYDTDAADSDCDIGDELDFFVHWKAYENLTLIARYGVFLPGAAYPRGTRDPSHYFYLTARLTI
ncbi:MAG: alginate export family protein [Candidatus Omnitrophica bacterium]|nr:alginate export family protein [Candidatus Omnitrophota bacterium]